jgi:putative membrane protein
MQHTKLVVGVTLLLLLVIFTVQNASVVSINFFFWELSISRSLMIFFVLAIGFIIGLITDAYFYTHKEEQR